jgi:hypothetical protein
MNYKALAAVIFSFIITGCTSAPPKMTIDTLAASALKGQTLHIQQADKSSFMYQTATAQIAGSMFGAIGGAIAADAAISNGKNLTTSIGLEDPAQSIEAKLATKLVNSYQMASVEKNDSKTPTHTGISLDVKTSGWGTQLDAMNYIVLYSADMELKDSTGKLLARGSCSHTTDKASYTSFNKIAANNGAWLKREMEAAVNKCAADML